VCVCARACVCLGEGGGRAHCERLRGLCPFSLAYAHVCMCAATAAGLHAWTTVRRSPVQQLVVGGLERVFEMGKVFRNEGARCSCVCVSNVLVRLRVFVCVFVCVCVCVCEYVCLCVLCHFCDTLLCARVERSGITSNHNPEFTMCEAYAAFADAESLMGFTEELLREVRCHLFMFILVDTWASAGGDSRYRRHRRAWRIRGRVRVWAPICTAADNGVAAGGSRGPAA
jgi:hypothetical protein